MKNIQMRATRLPHARGGVSSQASVKLSNSSVFPTHVGVFLAIPVLGVKGYRLPHARGGVSYISGSHVKGSESSPRTWGCFWSRRSSRRILCVFPTHVGVFLDTTADCNLSSGLPHARGGVSNHKVWQDVYRQSSPRTWGCFLTTCCVRMFGFVFPTHVGVFPWRGGGSREVRRSSPRTWGCFQSRPLYFG